MDWKADTTTHPFPGYKNGTAHPEPKLPSYQMSPENDEQPPIPFWLLRSFEISVVRPVVPTQPRSASFSGILCR